MAARSKAWVCGRSYAEIMGSNTTAVHGCLTVVSAVFCQVEQISAMGRSVDRRSHTENLVCLNVVSKPHDEDT